ncbi:carbohydrate ABC transporter permease [Streptomyces triticirhizae]|uniref:Sugar ABC transporter permease n=1 Tax=Streptomyces triticirhizae TaxID=2483353 RepID=A0A3M2MC99_9ACTN|nr:sugar ABC transporter permease [Streptomyces triticirhizae]RMI44828.1 sugar ABC transporter permease [Streptomyces triticirhizae]
MAVAAPRAPRRGGAPPRGGRGRSAALAGYLFVLPTVALFSVFVAYPFLRSMYLSLTRWSGFGTPDFVGLENFDNLVSDPVFWDALTTTLVFTLACTVLQTAVPLLLAVLLNRGWRLGVVFRTVIFVPAVVSFVVTGSLWQMVYDPNFGQLNQFLEGIGLGSLAQPWLADTTTVLPALVVVSLWQAAGLYMLIYLAGLQGIDPVLYEAARIDGATAYQRFRHVTVPMLRRVTAVVVLLNVVNGFKTFDVIYVMTGGGPNRASEVLGTYLYGLAFGSSAGAVPSFGYATAISMVVFVLCLLATLVQVRVNRKARDVH